jgi:hypothetical protein
VSSVTWARYKKGNFVCPDSSHTTSLVATFPDGLVTKVPVKRTWTVPNVSLWNITAPPPTEPATGVPTSTSAPDVPSAEGSSSSQAWIAGPVVGGVVVVSILAFTALFFWRIRPRRKAAVVTGHQGGGGRGVTNYHAEKDPIEKAQLPSDCVPRSTPQEMEGGAFAHSGTPLQKAQLDSDCIPRSTPQELDGRGLVCPGVAVNEGLTAELPGESVRVERGRVS